MTLPIAFLLPEHNLAYQIELPENLVGEMQLLHTIPGFQIHQLPNYGLRIYPPVSEIVYRTMPGLVTIFVKLDNHDQFWCIYNCQPAEQVEKTRELLVCHCDALTRYLRQLPVIDKMQEFYRILSMRSMSKRNAEIVMDYGVSAIFFERK